MNYKQTLAVMLAAMMAFTAIPLAELSADTPDEAMSGFTIASNPTQETYNEYFGNDKYMAMNTMYALGFYTSVFDYEVTLSNITYDASAVYSNYYFDTDETGVEQYFVYSQNYTMNIKFVATVNEIFDGYDLFMQNLVGDVKAVKDIIGSNFLAGDTVTVDARVTLHMYTECNETDMQRMDGLYICDSWDASQDYVMNTRGTAIFSVNGNTTETSFNTYDSESNVSICHWRYNTDISDVKVGDGFNYDRNNRLLYNSHFCNYKLGNGVYTISDTASTNSSYMDMKTEVDEGSFFTSSEINDSEYIYNWFFGITSTELAKVGTLTKDVGSAVFNLTTDKLNLIEEIPISIYSQDDIDKLNKTIDDLNEKEKQKKIIICTLVAIIIILIIVFAAVCMRRKAA